MNVRTLILILTAPWLLTGCQPEDTSPIGRYRTAVAEGLEEQVGVRDAVLGLELGIPKQEFYDRCTQLNQQQLITMAGGANLVNHRMPNDLDKPATLTFRPIFTGDGPPRVEAYELEFLYDDWAPWNKSSQSDVLLPDVADHLARTLGVDFIELQHPRHGRVYANVTDTRLTALWAEDPTIVKGMIVDLSLQPGDPLQLLTAAR
jgi:hypothetical protein